MSYYCRVYIVHILLYIILFNTTIKYRIISYNILLYTGIIHYKVMKTVQKTNVSLTPWRSNTPLLIICFSYLSVFIVRVPCTHHIHCMHIRVNISIQQRHEFFFSLGSLSKLDPPASIPENLTPSSIKHICSHT
jgi:hypothetical protein